MRGQFEFPFMRRERPDREHPDEEPPLPTDADAPLPLETPEHHPMSDDEAARTTVEHGPDATHVSKKTRRQRREERERGFAAIQQIRDRLNDLPRETLPGADSIDDAFEVDRRERADRRKPSKSDRKPDRA